MGRVVYHYPSLRIERNPGETWKLTVNEDATQMILDHSIHFTQPDPVLLLRTATPDPVPERLTELDFAPRAGSDLQGYWKGTFEPGGLPADLKVVEKADGTFRAEGDVPMEGVNGRPVLVTYSRPAVKLAVATGGGMFQGKINSANTEISGSWIEGGQSSSVIVKRADYQAEHAGDSGKNYAFTSGNDLQGHWKGTWILPFGKVRVKMRLALDIAKLPDGSFSATVANIDQFGRDDPIPTSSFQYGPKGLRMAWQWAGVRYEGKLKNGKLTGTWFQGGGGFPLVFERGGP
jgi:hypothetical protein